MSDRYSSSKQTLQELNKGDFVKFKFLTELPKCIRGETWKVKKVQAYIYDSVIFPEFVLIHPDYDSVTAMYDPVKYEVSFSMQLSEDEIEFLFDSKAIGEVWLENAEPSRLVPNTQSLSPEKLDWISNSYVQTDCYETGHFFEEDLRGVIISEIDRDDGELCNYCEFRGRQDKQGLTIEQWDDDEFEYFAEIFTLDDVIDSVT